MIDDTLALLDEMNEAGRIEYDDYRALHDVISVITLPIPDADVAGRIARALEEAAEKHPNPVVRLNLSDAADIARSHATPPVAATCDYRFPLPSWAGEDQMDRRACVLAANHDGAHTCSATPTDVTPT